MNNEQLLKKAQEMCKDRGHELLYLVRFGSELYGTNTQNSDTDVKGIFLPSKKSLLLGQKCQHLNFKTGDDKSKNSSEDVDLQLWSLHYWLSLVQLGDTNALDLLYAHTNASMAIMQDYALSSFIGEFHSKLYNKKRLHGYLGYILGQAKKYGIKGSRLGVIKRVWEWLIGYDLAAGGFDRLSQHSKAILAACEEPSYCFSREVNGENALVICGKVHLESITMDEFRGRINREYERYGERARLAEQNEGIDWKAISHAFRSGYQMHQLLREDQITFPLEHASFLKRVKAGKIDWEVCERGLTELVEEVKTLQDRVECDSVDFDLIEGFILSYYN